MTDRKIPEYLDPGSMGGWVRIAQEQMVYSAELGDLEAHVPEPTGIHEGTWVEFTKALQLIWGIDTDGGIGPQFREEYQKRVGHILFNNIAGPNPSAPTVAIGPNDEKGAFFSFGKRDAPRGDQKLLQLASYGDRERPPMSGGDGMTRMTTKAKAQMHEQMREIKEKGGQVLLINDSHTHSGSLSDWRNGWGCGESRKPITVDFFDRLPQEPGLWLQLIFVTETPLLVVMSEHFRSEVGY